MPATKLRPQIEYTVERASASSPRHIYAMSAQEDIIDHHEVAGHWDDPDELTLYGSSRHPSRHPSPVREQTPSPELAARVHVPARTMDVTFTWRRNSDGTLDPSVSKAIVLSSLYDHLKDFRSHRLNPRCPCKSHESGACNLVPDLKRSLVALPEELEAVALESLLNGWRGDFGLHTVRDALLRSSSDIELTQRPRWAQRG